MGAGTHPAGPLHLLPCPAGRPSRTAGPVPGTDPRAPLCGQIWGRGWSRAVREPVPDQVHGKLCQSRVGRSCAHPFTRHPSLHPCSHHFIRAPDLTQVLLGHLRPGEEHGWEQNGSHPPGVGRRARGMTGHDLGRGLYRCRASVSSSGKREHWQLPPPRALVHVKCTGLGGCTVGLHGGGAPNP